MTLPPLPPIELPFIRKEPPPAPATDASGMERILGPAPALPVALATPIRTPAPLPPVSAPDSTPPKSLAFERRLDGLAFAKVSTEQDGSASKVSLSQSADPAVFFASRTRMGDEAEGSPQALNGLLRPTVTPTVAASLLPTRRFLLSKGAFIDCTLETAIDSTLPGMTTCITATDTFSADGTVVLLERGTKLVGETRGEVRQGAHGSSCSGRKLARRPVSSCL